MQLMGFLLKMNQYWSLEWGIRLGIFKEMWRRIPENSNRVYYFYTEF